MVRANISAKNNLFWCAGWQGCKNEKNICISKNTYLFSRNDFVIDQWVIQTYNK